MTDHRWVSRSFLLWQGWPKKSFLVGGCSFEPWRCQGRPLTAGSKISPSVKRRDMFAFRYTQMKTPNPDTVWAKLSPLQKGLATKNSPPGPCTPACRTQTAPRTSSPTRCPSPGQSLQAARYTAGLGSKGWFVNFIGFTYQFCACACVENLHFGHGTKCLRFG